MAKNSSSEFGRHGIEGGSSLLRRLFRERPYQGHDPEHAEYVFLGLDANLDKGIEESELFPLIHEYLADGVRFWKKHNVHHPLLLKGAGRPGAKYGVKYHRCFQQMLSCVEPASAVRAELWSKRISFVELLNVPTYGRSGGTNKRRYLQYVSNPENITHVRRLVEKIFRSTTTKKLFVVGITTLKRLVELGRTPDLEPLLGPMRSPKKWPKANEERIRPIEHDYSGRCTMFPITHFSAAVSGKHLAAVARLLSS
jgi:hypothetical protein